MKKQTKVLVAATLLTLGASFSSLAALKNGTWVPSEEGWQYLDKEGDAVESTWAMSNGVEFWLNDEGYLGASEWVTDDEDGYTYYVQSDGSKAKNVWKKLYAEDDEEAEEESWFYFDSKGRARGIAAKVSAEKNHKDEVYGELYKVDGVEYAFNAEGKMLTGWVDSKNFVAADEDTATVNVRYINEDGSVAKKQWINSFAWDATELEAEEFYPGDEVWYYATSNGKLAVKKTNDIEGHTYFFNTKGEMLTGWVADIDGVCTDADALEDAKLTLAEWNKEGTAVYFADEESGYMKKGSWRQLDNIAGDEFWYSFDKLGRLVMATGSDAELATVKLELVDGEDVEYKTTDAGVVEVKKIDGVKYYFRNNGEMLDGFVKIGKDMMYLADGVKKTGKVVITDDNENDYTFCFDKDGVAVDGNEDGYCYKNGMLQTSEESGVYKLVTLDDGTQFIVDYRGKIQHNNKKDYELEDGKEYNGTFSDKKGATKDSVLTLVEVTE